MVDLAPAVTVSPATQERQHEVGKGLSRPVRAKPRARVMVYWLAIATALTVADLIASTIMATSGLTAGERAGIRFNILTLIAALALTITTGIAAPRWWRRSIALLLLAPVPILLLTSHNGKTGAATLLIVFIASWLGREAAARVLGRLDLIVAWAVGATFGIGLIAAFGFVAGTLGLLVHPAIWSLLVTLAVGLTVSARARLRRDARVVATWITGPVAPSWLQLLLVGAALACYWLNLLGALTPETRSDAVRQRLATAALFARNGNLQPSDVDLFVAKEPALGEITYAAVITASSLQGAKILHFFVGVLCAIVIFAIARRLGSPFGGGLAAFAFYCTLMTGWLSQTAYLDLFTTLFALTPALLFVIRPHLHWRVAAAAGICIGLGVAVKLHFGYVAVGLGITAGLIALRYDSLRRAAQVGAILTGTAILSAAPWIARAYMLTSTIPGVALGTTSLSTGSDEQASSLFDLKTFGFGRSLWDLLALPFTTTLAGSRFGGQHLDTNVLGGHIGYLLLGFFPLLLLLWKDRRTSAVVAGATVATIVWFYTAQYLRYGLPMIATFLALGGIAYARLQRHFTAPVWRTAAGILICTLAFSGVAIRLQLPDHAHRYAFGLQSRESFLDEHLDSYAVLRALDTEPRVTRILAMWDGPRLYSEVRISSPYTSASGVEIEGPDELVMQRLREGGFSHILIDRRASSIPFFGWDRMAITNEDFLRRNTTLVAGGQYIYLYRILAPEQFATAPPWALGSERVTNGGFEQAEADHLMGWGRSGNPQHDQSGTSSRNGAGAVRLSPDDGISTTVTIEPGRTYLATGATRSIEGYGLVEMRIEWFDQKGKLIGISREKMLSSPLGYRAYSILATAPKQAHTAIVTIRADDGQAWVDDVSLRSVTRDTSASATTLPPFILLP